MTLSDDENESLVQFLESECLVEVSDQESEEESEEEEEEEERRTKRICLNESYKHDDRRKEEEEKEMYAEKPRSKDSDIFCKIPSELFPSILKFLSSEDLMACSLVSKYLSYVASDDSLWRRLYCMRWGPSSKSSCAWKKLYIQRDKAEVSNLLWRCPPEFKECFIQMNASKRSQAPLPSQVKDDVILLDKTVTDQVSRWKGGRGLTNKVFVGHTFSEKTCSSKTCSYHQIGNVFVCEKTGNVHVCGDTCKEIVEGEENDYRVCTISGLCFGGVGQTKMIARLVGC